MFLECRTPLGHMLITRKRCVEPVMNLSHFIAELRVREDVGRVVANAFDDHRTELDRIHRACQQIFDSLARLCVAFLRVIHDARAGAAGAQARNPNAVMSDRDAQR